MELAYWFCAACSINHIPEWGLLGGSTTLTVVKSELGPATWSSWSNPEEEEEGKWWWKGVGK